MCGNMGGGGGSSGKGNNIYNGFSITDMDGKTNNYIVINNEVFYADMHNSKNVFGENKLESIQQAYNIEGNVKGLIGRINKIGQAQAKTISDKEVEEIQKKYKADKEEAEKQFIIDAYRDKKYKSGNRHRLYWSAM